MANQDVTDLKRDGLHPNLADVDRPKRVRRCHAMRTWRDFDRAVLPCNPHQAKTDNDRIGGEPEVKSLWKEWTLVVNMRALVLRSAQGHIAAPLVSNDPVVHKAAHHTQHIRIEEELRCEAGWLKRHCKKVAMWATVRLRVAPEICEQARPEGVSARVNEA
jgi:hypothetical protein